MKPFQLFAALVALLCANVAATSVTEAMALYPTCALACLKELIPQSECSLTNTTCLCTNVPLNTQISACVLKGCKVYDQLQTKNASLSLCDPSPPRDISTKVIIDGVVPGAIALLVFILRLCASIPENSRPLGMEDWTMCIMVALTVPPTVFAVLLANHGLGKDMWTLPAEDITAVLRLYYMGELFYFAALTMNKVSILFFILRIFPAKPLRIGAYIGLGLAMGYGIAFIFATAFQCSPISLAWNIWDGEHEGHCNNIHLQGWMSAICNIVVDVYIIILPLRELSKLKMDLAKKLMLIFMFSLGIFVTITSVIRLRTLIVFADTQNLTWDYVDAATWSTVELHVGIICASLPSLRNLFVSMGAKILKTTSGMSKNSHGYGSTAKNSKHSLSATPKKGDEDDFIRLVDVESHGEKNSGRSLSTNDSKGGIVMESGLSVRSHRL